MSAFDKDELNAEKQMELLLWLCKEAKNRLEMKSTKPDNQLFNYRNSQLLQKAQMLFTCWRMIGC